MNFVDFTENLRTMHFYNRYNQDIGNRGGLTVVYDWVKGDSFITISTAVCSKSDAYNRSLGRKIAIQNYLDGNSVRLPFNKKVWKNPRNMLRTMFADSIEDSIKGDPLFVGKDNSLYLDWL